MDEVSGRQKHQMHTLCHSRPTLHLDRGSTSFAEHAIWVVLLCLQSNRTRQFCFYRDLLHQYIIASGHSNHVQQDAGCTWKVVRVVPFKCPAIVVNRLLMLYLLYILTPKHAQLTGLSGSCSCPYRVSIVPHNAFMPSQTCASVQNAATRSHQTGKRHTLLHSPCSRREGKKKQARYLRHVRRSRRSIST